MIIKTHETSYIQVMTELYFLINFALNAHFTAVFICLVSELSFIQRRSALTCAVFC